MTHTIQRNAAKIVAISLRLFAQAVALPPNKPLALIPVLDTAPSAE
jgi:hypothetical protein